MYKLEREIMYNPQTHTHSYTPEAKCWQNDPIVSVQLYRYPNTDSTGTFSHSSLYWEGAGHNKMLLIVFLFGHVVLRFIAGSVKCSVNYHLLAQPFRPLSLSTTATKLPLMVRVPCFHQWVELALLRIELKYL
jgi:hypothetical protein